ncbi:MAG: S-layer homology domain-containing protein, partial [Acidimicrobiia bacterium]|nr:S-layer homology domain-containing protein [Acidimicrobiia bacterium]
SLRTNRLRLPDILPVPMGPPVPETGLGCPVTSPHATGRRSGSTGVEGVEGVVGAATPGGASDEESAVYQGCYVAQGGVLGALGWLRPLRSGQLALEIVCLYALGVTAGTSPSTYSPDQHLTRAQVATMLVRIWQASGRECPSDADMPFVDVAAELHDPQAG